MPTPQDLITGLQGNEDPDAMVLLQMAQIGADLRKPHEPDFAFEVAEQENAKALAAELARLDYDVEIYPPDDESPDYKVNAKRVMVLTLEILNGLSADFEALAKKYEAVYDGWGAEIVE